MMSGMSWSFSRPSGLSKMVMFVLCLSVFFGSALSSPEVARAQITSGTSVDTPWCDPDGVDANGLPYSPRPYWSELGPVPDYVNVSNNLNFNDSLTLLISMMEKAMALVEDFIAPYESDSVGVCVCNCNQPLDFWVNYLKTTLKTNLLNAIDEAKTQYVDGLKNALEAAKGEMEDTIPQFATDLEQIIQTSMDNLNAANNNIFTDPNTAVQTFVEGLRDTAKDKVEAIFQDEKAQVEAILGDAINGGIAQVEAQFNDMQGEITSNLLSLNFKGLKDNFSDLLDTVKVSIQDILDTAIGVGQTYANGIANGSQVQDWVNLVMADVETYVDNYVDTAVASVDAEMQSMKTQIQTLVDTKVSDIKGTITNLFDLATNYDAPFDTFKTTLTQGVLSDLSNVDGCYGEITRSECTADPGGYCEAGGTGTILGGQIDVPVWFPTETFKDGKTAAKFALEHLKFLEGVLDWVNTAASNFLSFGVSFIDALEDAQDFLNQFNEYVDRFTDGYHLGTYSQVRPDLHMCVGYGGHKTYSQVASINLGDHSVAGGGSYKSFNLLKKHRGQFRSGGFSISIDDKVLQLMPGVSLNIQMDGFRMWDKYYPFSLGAGAGNYWGNSPNNFSFDTNNVDQVDVFNLVDQQTLELLCPGNTGPCQLTPTSFLYEGFFPADYPDPADSYVWPRGLPWEEDLRITAVFGLGLNLEFTTKEFREDLPPGGILLFAPPTVYLSPWVSLKAGMGWTYAANSQRTLIQDRLNQNLPAADHLTPLDFSRHAIPLTGDIFTDGEHFQAPDVTEDVGHSAYVRPQVGADLDVGLKIGKWLKIGVTASLFLGLDLDAAAFAGVLDLNRALIEALAESNPDGDDCHAVIESNETTWCSNRVYTLNSDCPPGPACQVDADCDSPQTCDDNGNCTTDCVDLTPEQPDPDTLYSTVQYGCDSGAANNCAQFGYCIGDDGEIIAHDVSEAECEAVGVAPGACVASHEWNGDPCGCGVPVGPGSWYLGAQGGPPRSFPFYFAYATESETYRDGEMLLAQAEAQQFTDKASCESHGWCMQWAQNPDAANIFGLPSFALPEEFIAVFNGVGTNGNTCPPGVYTEDVSTLDLIASAGETINYIGTQNPVVGQHWQFHWVCNHDGSPVQTGTGTMWESHVDTSVAETYEGFCDTAPVSGLNGSWFPYTCMTSSQPEVVGWTGPDCNPLEFGYPSACSCWDDDNCVDSCLESNLCEETDGTSCSCLPNQGAVCPDGRVCVDGGCLTECVTDADCGYGMVCGADDACVMENGVPFAEQVIYEMLNVNEPRHAVASYALNKLVFSVVMGAAVKVGLRYKIFRKWREKNLFSWSDEFPLVEFPFVKHQLGMQVDYQDDCAAALGYFQNHQPSFVTRPLGLQNGATADEVMEWCLPLLQEDTYNPDAEEPDQIGTDLDELFIYSKLLAESFWAAHQLCIDGVPYYEWVTNMQLDDQVAWDNMICEYDDNPVMHDIMCVDEESLFAGVLLALGCMDISGSNALSENVDLGNSGLPGSFLSTYTPMANGVTSGPTQNVLDPFEVFIDLTADELVHPSNIHPSVAAQNGSAGFNYTTWRQQVNTCIDDVADGGRYDDDKFDMFMVLDPEECDPCDLPNPDPDCDNGPIMGACCTSGGSCAVVTEVACTVILNGTWTAGVDCGQINCGVPTSGCCLPDDTCQVMAPSACQNVQGTVQVDCTVPCWDDAPGLDACCLPTGGCSDLTVQDCANAGGTSHGGVLCGDPGVCVDNLSEACCLPDGSCFMLTPFGCTQSGGSMQAGGTCNLPGICAQPDPGACCLPGGCVLVESWECAAQNGVWDGSPDCSSACADPCDDGFSGQCAGVGSYASQCSMTGLDCGGANAIQADSDCDGQYDICQNCPPGTEPIDTNGDGCEDTCGCCPDSTCQPNEVPINTDADACLEDCMVPGAGLCNDGITGMCGGHDYTSQCDATICGSIGIQSDMSCDGQYDSCTACPSGTQPVDTTGDGCPDSCDCCPALTCLSGQVAVDLDGDGCDDVCADPLPTLCPDGLTGLCLGYDYTSQCDPNNCGGVGVQGDTNCDGLYDVCYACPTGTAPVDTTGNGCADSCDCVTPPPTGACCTDTNCYDAVTAGFCEEAQGNWFIGHACSDPGICGDEEPCEEVTGVCDGFDYSSQCNATGLDCGGFGILGDQDCDGQFEVCLSCPPGSYPADTTGDGCEDKCVCPCEDSIEGQCKDQGFDYSTQCDPTGLDCGTVGIQADQNCDGKYEVCVECPPGTAPVDTNGDGCEDMCDCVDGGDEDGACCIDGQCSMLLEGTCLENGGTWDSTTTCADNPCDPGTEVAACCLPNGQCIDELLVKCDSNNGVWNPGSLCSDPGFTCGGGPEVAACCLPSGQCQDMELVKCDSNNGVWNQYESCQDPDFMCPSSSEGACCLDGQCFENGMTECVANNGIWNPGADCQDPNFSCDPGTDVAACCLPNGQCIDELLVKCDSNNGVWNPGSLCADPGFTCGDPDTGACCVGGQCTNTTMAQCHSSSGVWNPGEDCNDTTFICGDPPQIAACCLPGGQCEDKDEAKCEFEGGIWHPAALCSDPNFSCGDAGAGACCVDGQCQMISEKLCIDIFGVWSPGADCQQPDVCDSPTAGSCCLGGQCYENSMEECAANDGIWNAGVGCADKPCEDDVVCCKGEVNGQCIPFGDINQSMGDPNVVDVQCTIVTVLYVLGGGQGEMPPCLGEQGLDAADANCDGNVDVTDVLLVINVALGNPIGDALDADGSMCPDSCEDPVVCEPVECESGDPIDTDGDECPDSCSEVECPPGYDGPNCDVPLEGCFWYDIPLCETGGSITDFCNGGQVNALETCSGSYTSVSESDIPGTVNKDYLTKELNGCECISENTVSWGQVECCYASGCQELVCPAGSVGVDLDDDGCDDECQQCELPMCPPGSQGVIDSDGDGCLDTCLPPCDIEFCPINTEGEDQDDDGCIDVCVPICDPVTCDNGPGNPGTPVDTDDDGCADTCEYPCDPVVCDEPGVIAVDKDGDNCADDCEPCESLECPSGFIAVDVDGDQCDDECQECIIPMCPAGSQGVIDANGDGCLDTCLPPCEIDICPPGEIAGSIDANNCIEFCVPNCEPLDCQGPGNPVDTDDDGCADTCEYPCDPVVCEPGFNAVDKDGDNCAEDCEPCQSLECPSGFIAVDVDGDQCDDECQECIIPMCPAGSQGVIDANGDGCLDTCLPPCEIDICPPGEIAGSIDENNCIEFCVPNCEPLDCQGPGNPVDTDDDGCADTCEYPCDPVACEPGFNAVDKDGDDCADTCEAVQVQCDDNNVWTGHDNTLCATGAPCSDLRRIVPHSAGGHLIAGWSGENNNNTGLLIRLDANGQELWSKLVAGNGYCYFQSVAEGANENVAVGHCLDGLTYNSHALIYAFDNSGKELWKKEITGGSADQPFMQYEYRGIRAVEGGYVISGYSYSMSLGQKGHVLKINGNGDVQWETDVFSNGGAHGGAGVVADAGGTLLTSSWHMSFQKQTTAVLDAATGQELSQTTPFTCGSSTGVSVDYQAIGNEKYMVVAPDTKAGTEQFCVSTGDDSTNVLAAVTDGNGVAQNEKVFSETGYLSILGTSHVGNGNVLVSGSVTNYDVSYTGVAWVLSVSPNLDENWKKSFAAGEYIRHSAARPGGGAILVGRDTDQKAWWTCVDAQGNVECCGVSDACPDDPNKEAPGVCGCGVADTDTDDDGTPDCDDGCPNDPEQTDATLCTQEEEGSDCECEGWPYPDTVGTPCTVDLSVCDESAKAPAWKGMDTLSGTLNCASYGNTFGMMCMANYPYNNTTYTQGFPVEPYEGWWCGEVVSVCKAIDEPVDNCPDDPEKLEPGLCGCGTADADLDGDQVPDCDDGCPLDIEKTEPGTCGCGKAETDSDQDGTPDCIDACPDNPEVITGDCGIPSGCACPTLQTDPEILGLPCTIDLSMCDESQKSSSWKGKESLEGTLICTGYTLPSGAGTFGMGCTVPIGDSAQGWPIDTPADWWCGEVLSVCTPPKAPPTDNCLDDPEKLEPGVCGCGIADVDSDGDSVLDCEDNCPNDPEKLEPGTCGCNVAYTDTDMDGLPDCIDPCPNTVNCETSDGPLADNCPEDPAKIAPGVCGCGNSDADLDYDGQITCENECLGYLNCVWTYYSGITEKGTCGCVKCPSVSADPYPAQCPQP